MEVEQVSLYLYRAARLRVAHFLVPRYPRLPRRYLPRPSPSSPHGVVHGVAQKHFGAVTVIGSVSRGKLEAIMKGLCGVTRRRWWRRRGSGGGGDVWRSLFPQEPPGKLGK
ncbi:hypothetical protein O3P69_004401 [Scylla paramamosain]|uniref:Uncharacterized protein n=1 Tax=Scylla paramamosain TaxID=85552 RepID=A0AAW0UBV1_SCYPA